MPADDSKLLIDTRRGDQNAARSLWHRHAPRLIAYARALLRSRGSSHDAEDIVQTVFCRVMDLGTHDLATVRDTGAWLAQITRRTALNWLRTHRRDAVRRERSAAASARRPTASADIAISEAIDALPTRLREVVVLKHVADLTFDQIELATGINRNTAAARYRSALAMLRESLEPALRSTTASTPLPRQNRVQHA